MRNYYFYERNVWMLINIVNLKTIFNGPKKILNLHCNNWNSLKIRVSFINTRIVVYFMPQNNNLNSFVPNLCKIVTSISNLFKLSYFQCKYLLVYSLLKQHTWLVLPECCLIKNRCIVLLWKVFKFLLLTQLVESTVLTTQKCLLYVVANI